MQPSGSHEKVEPEPDAVLMSKRDLVYLYYPGEFPSALSDRDKYEEEFKRGLEGNSKYFDLTVQPIFDTPGKLRKKEILLRGGKQRDTAPYHDGRMANMTPEESFTLLKTTLRRYKDEERCTVNILETEHLPLCRTNKRIVAEITRRIIEKTTQEMVENAKRQNPLLDVWADDVPFNSPDAMYNIYILLRCLDGIKIATVDLARAYQVPIVKNPIDSPDITFAPTPDPALRAVIDQFLIMLSASYPDIIVVLELDIPRDLLPTATKDMDILTQGGRHGARAFQIATYDAENMTQTTKDADWETYTSSAAQPTGVKRTPR